MTFELIPQDQCEASLEFGEHFRLDRVATAKLPTKYGDFRIASFQNNKDGKEHVAVFKGEIEDASDVLTRIHSECLTGDVFGSLKCDCGEQLERALSMMANGGPAILVYMRQEGRGIGLINKIRAYKLQDGGLDTVEANQHLGFDDDLRTYDVAAAIIQLLRIKSIILMTNNPKKVAGLQSAGVTVSRREPIEIAPNPHNHDYLETKSSKSGHIFQQF